MPLKHVPMLYSKKMRGNLAFLNDFLAAPPPRIIPKEVLQDIAPPTLKYGRILFAIGIPISGLIIMIALKTPAIRLPIFAGVGFYLMTLVGLLFYLRGYGIWHGRFRALKSGELREAVITDLSATDFRNNGRHYYKLSFSFTGPAGKTISASEYIPDRIVPFFEQLQAENDEGFLDVLCTPGTFSRPYLPLLYVLTANKA